MEDGCFKEGYSISVVFPWPAIASKRNQQFSVVLAKGLQNKVIRALNFQLMVYFFNSFHIPAIPEEDSFSFTKPFFCPAVQLAYGSICDPAKEILVCI